MYAIVTDVHKEDAYYPHRDKVIGSIIKINNLTDIDYNGWKRGDGEFIYTKMKVEAFVFYKIKYKEIDIEEHPEYFI